MLSGVQGVITCGCKGFLKAVRFFFWLSRKNGRAAEKIIRAEKIFRAYSRLPTQKFISPYAYDNTHERYYKYFAKHK